MTKIIGFIPARGGSTRVPDKNLRPVAGVSLTRRAAFCANNTGIFDEVYVSTDSELIANEVSDLCSVDVRPAILGNDSAKIIDVLKEFVSRNKIKPNDVVGIMLTTCALRLPTDVQGAYAKFLDAGGETSVVSVAEYETPVHLAFQLTQDGYLENMFPHDYKASTRSVDHPKSYRYNGAILFRKARDLMSSTTLVGEHAIPFLMDRERSIDIDWEYQMRFVAKILEEQLNEI